MQLSALDQYLRSLLTIESFDSIDASLNGLQVGRNTKEVSKVACAVDASIATIEAAVRQEADVLFVHHGLFWGSCIPIVGATYRRISLLTKYDLGLYACHLPLDADMIHGNNACIARALGLCEISPFGIYRGTRIGVKGRLPSPRPMDELSKWFSSPLAVLPFGKKEVQTIAIISGGALHEVQQAIDQEIDLYITGDASHNIYHQCLESKINMISAGHYATEIWGVQSIAEALKEEKNLETSFIDIPTGL